MGQYKNKADAIDAILRRSATDSDFRHRLLVDPIAGVEEVINQKVSEGLRLRFVEKPKDVDAIFVLPDSVEQADLSDAELEAVAGGAGGDPIDECEEDPEGGWTCGLSCGCTGGTTLA